MWLLISKKEVVPFVIPNVLGVAISSAGWADAATIIPWNMYLAYGDKEILKDQYESMKAMGGLYGEKQRTIYGIQAFILATGYFTGRRMIMMGVQPLPINI